jgi:hypothetical protein
MNKPFKLDAHPRRPRPLLSEPPSGYFDQLPTRVMARLPRAGEPAALGWGWLAQLPAALRTSLAAMVLLGSFAASFWLSGPAQPVAVASANTSLDAVPQAQLVGYLLNSGARVENVDLAVLAAAQPDLPGTFMHASEAELADALDAQPADESTYF